MTACTARTTNQPCTVITIASAFTALESGISVLARAVIKPVRRKSIIERTHEVKQHAPPCGQRLSSFSCCSLIFFLLAQRFSFWDLVGGASHGHHIPECDWLL